MKRISHTGVRWFHVKAKHGCVAVFALVVLFMFANPTQAQFFCPPVSKSDCVESASKPDGSRCNECDRQCESGCDRDRDQAIESCDGECCAKMPESAWVKVGSVLPSICPPDCVGAYRSNGAGESNPRCPTSSCCSDRRELATSLCEVLSGAEISPTTRREMIESALDLVEENARLKADNEIVRARLVHEREIADLQSRIMQMQVELASRGEVGQWMGAIHTNQNQVRQQLADVMNDLQIVNRTFRMLETSRDSSRMPERADGMATIDFRPIVAPKRQTNQFYDQAPRPERWSQLPNFTSPPASRKDKSTQTPDAASPGTTQANMLQPTAPPRRYSELELRREKIQQHIRSLESELASLEKAHQNPDTTRAVSSLPQPLLSPGPVRRASWNAPLPARLLVPAQTGVEKHVPGTR